MLLAKADPYRMDIERAAKQYGFDPMLLHGLVETESGYDPEAKSDAGAVGIMQLMPGTAKEIGVDPTDPLESIYAGAKYLRKQVDRFGGDIEKGLAAYNYGGGNVQKLIDKYGDKWKDHLPKETAAHGKKSMKYIPKPDKGMIRVEIEGQGPIEFEVGTPMEVIQRKVKELTTGVDPRTGERIGTITAETTGRILKEAITAEGPAVVGGIAGGIAAAATGVGLPLMAGAVALGAGGGESLRQLGQHLSGSQGAPQTSIEAAKRIGAKGFEEGAWEVAGGLAMKGLRRILAPYKKTISEGAQETAEFFKDKIKPVVLMPSETTEARTLDLLHNVAEASLIGGNRIAEFKTSRLKFYNDFADSLIDQFGERTDPSDLGNLFVATIEKKREVHGKISRILYNNVSEAIEAGGGKIPDDVNDIVGDFGEELIVRRLDRIKNPGKYKNVDELISPRIDPDFPYPKTDADEIMASLDELDDRMLDVVNKYGRKSAVSMFERVTKPGVQVSTKSLKDFVAPLKSIADDIGSIEAKNAGDDLIAAIEDLPDHLSFDAARELRSRLIARVDEFSVLNKKAPAIGKAKKMIGLIDRAIERSLKGFDKAGGTLDKWRIANRFYREGQEKFNNVMIRRLVKLAEDTGTGAEMIAPAIFKPGAISKVKKARAAMDPPTWRKMKGFFIQHLMQKATDVDGMIKGKRLINHISGKPNSFGIPMMEEILSKPQLDELMKFAKALELSQGRQAEGAGKVLIQLTQAGAMGTLASGTLELPSAFIIFGPAVLSRMMLSPTVTKWLTKGVGLPIHSEAAGGLMARLVKASYKIKRDMERENEE